MNRSPQRLRGNLPHAPQVGAQHPTGDAAIGRMVDQDRKRGTTRTHGKGAMNGGHMNATGISDGLSGKTFGESDADFHTNQFRTSCDKSKSELRSSGEIAKIAIFAQPLGMTKQRLPRPNDPWPQRFFVLELIDQAIENGATLDELAKAFGLGTPYSMETGWRYNYDRKPHGNTVEKMAEYFNLPISKIYDPKPTQEQTKDELTLAKDALSGAMGSDVLSKLSDDQILAAYRVAMATAKAMLSQ